MSSPLRCTEFLGKSSKTFPVFSRQEDKWFRHGGAHHAPRDLDETGNTGANLNDVQQPVFVLAALIVPEGRWQDLERDLETILATLFPTMAADGLEVHAKDIRNGTGHFKEVPSAQRLQLRDEWLK